MRSKWIVLLCFLGLVVSAAHAGSGVNVNEGKWQITVETEVIGMPMKMPASTYDQCIKKDEPIPRQEQPGQECKTSDFKTSGNTVSWTMTCKTPGGDMVGKGKVTYAGDTMDGNMEMETQGMKMKSHFSGKRVGECK